MTSVIRFQRYRTRVRTDCALAGGADLGRWLVVSVLARDLSATRWEPHDPVGRLTVMRVSIRLSLLLALIGLIAAACDYADGESATTSSLIVEEAREQSLSEEEVATVIATAVATACTACEDDTVYIRNHLLTTETKVGEEQAMPEPVRIRLSELSDEVVFVDSTEELEVLGEDHLPDDGTVVYVGPVQVLAENVVGVEVGTITPGDGFKAQTVQFQWDGTSWNVATSDETGVTVTTAVS